MMLFNSLNLGEKKPQGIEFKQRQSLTWKITTAAAALYPEKTKFSFKPQMRFAKGLR